jgi:hypothetical protein
MAASKFASSRRFSTIDLACERHPGAAASRQPQQIGFDVEHARDHQIEQRVQLRCRTVLSLGARLYHRRVKKT